MDADRLKGSDRLGVGQLEPWVLNCLKGSDRQGVGQLEPWTLIRLKDFDRLGIWITLKALTD